jgi:hypothetical protein
MNVFSCYVDVERFLGLPVKELVRFLVCLPYHLRIPTIVLIANFFQHVDKTKDFIELERTKKEEFLSSIPLKEHSKTKLWKLLKNFFLKHSENLSGKEIPQNDLIALRKGRLFEELVFNLGPINRKAVTLTCLHCQPMVNRRKLKIFCSKKDLSSKNIDVAFWGRNYVEGFECKGNVKFFIRLGMGNSERSRKVREKILYLHLLSKELKRYFSDVHIYLASFAPEIDINFSISTCKKWVKEYCGNEKLQFRIITVKDFLREI